MTSDIRRSVASSRRDYLRKGTAAAITLPALSVLGACESKAAASPKVTTPTVPATPPSPQQRADAMDAMHEKGINAFPAKTQGKGNQLFAPRIEAGVKVYDLTAEEIQWEVEPGRKVKALPLVSGGT